MSRAASIVRNPFVWAFVLGIVTLTALRPLLRHVPEPPPVLGEVPPFELTDPEGRPFGREALLGHVTIADLFSTRCPAGCREIQKGLRRIQDAYEERRIEGISLLSVSTDPAFDTPARLLEYARSIGARPGRWTFLTGDAETVKRIARELFADPSRASGPARPLVLIDPKGRIRGWYGADEMGLDEIYNRAQHVLAETAP